MDALWQLFDKATGADNVTGLPTTIRLRRTELSLSRRELADIAKISYNRLSDLENGKRDFGMIDVSALAVALNWTMTDMLTVACIRRGLVFGRNEISRLLG